MFKVPLNTCSIVDHAEKMGFPPHIQLNPPFPLSLLQNPALLSMVQGKLNTLVGKPSGYIKSLPPAVKRRIEGLKGIQQEHAKIENEFQLEILELEKKVSYRM
jgi:nucleosome assembly protein 1-like 1